jgi:hypothetical protein
MRTLFTDPLARFTIRFAIGWLFIGLAVVNTVNLIAG